MGEIYAVSMNKGGVGKTSLVTNLAGAISTMKKKVLIVDTDGQGSSIEAFGIDPDNLEHTIYDVLLGKKKAEDVKIKLAKNIDILPSNYNMNFLEFDILPKIENYPNRDYFKLIEKAIKPIKDDYDYILIDTPPSMGLVQMNVLSMADKIIVPVVPETHAMKGLYRILKGINEFKIENKLSLEIVGVIIMMVDYRTSLHSEYAQQIKSYCKDVVKIKCFETEIRKSIRFADAVASENKPATLTKYVKNDKNGIIQSYFELTKELFR